MDLTKKQKAYIQGAINLIEKQLTEKGPMMSSSPVVRDYLRLQLTGLQAEQFCIMFLDTQLRLIEFKVMFTGTLNSAAVYPREIVKAALLANAGFVILAHNHPSGVAEPSIADRRITDDIVNSLKTVSIGVVDHVVVGDFETVSFAERGWIQNGI